MERIYNYTIKLIRYVLNGSIPELTESIDFDDLYNFGAKHGIENMLYIALSDLNVSVPNDVMNKFKQAYEMQIMVEATQAIELECVGEAFKKNGIEYMPLKGSIVKYLYPMPDYRKSGDIDILIHPKDEKKVNKVMLENQYVIDEMDEFELHVGYRKPPFILVEIHDRLLEKSNRSYEVFKDVWSSTDVNIKEETEYEMSHELFYVFSVAHFCKHIKNGGAGIKFITDIYLMKKCWKELQNSEKVKDMLSKANLTEFESFVNEILEYWFGDHLIMNKNIKWLEQYVLRCGAFGNEENKWNLHACQGVGAKNKLIVYRLKQIVTRICPSYMEMKKSYVWLKKCPILLPVAWFLRSFRLLSKDNDNIKRRLKVNEEISEDLVELWNAVK